MPSSPTGIGTTGATAGRPRGTTRDEQRLELRALAGELGGVGDVLPLTPAARAEMGAAGRHADSVAPYFTPSSSTSKTSAALGGMSPPAPRAP